MSVEDDLKDLKIQFYSVSAVLAFFVIVLIAVIIELHVRVKKIKNNEESDDENLTNKSRPPPPQVNSGFSFSKPTTSRNWPDSEIEIRRQNEQQEFSIPKPALSKSWQVYPGDNSRDKVKRTYGNDYQQADNISSYSYEGKNSSSAFRNPLSGNNDDGQNYNHTKQERQAPRPPNFGRMPSSGNNFNGGANDNFGFKRDFQRNNYY